MLEQILGSILGMIFGISVAGCLITIKEDLKNWAYILFIIALICSFGTGFFAGMAV